MKVCMIYDFLTEFGGLEREIVSHARMLRREGHEVSVVTCHVDPETVKKMEFRDIPIINISKIKTSSEFVALALCFLGLNKLDKINPDMFVSYSFPSNYLIRNKKALKVNYVNHYPHFLYLSEKEKKEWAYSTKGVKRRAVVIASWLLGENLKKIDRKLIRANDLNLMNSKYTQRRLDKLYGLNSKVSYPPLDTIFKPSKKRIDEKFIFSSSRIIPDKKYDWLIESCSYMKNKLPLYISGQGEPDFQNKLKGLAKKRKVKLKFVGRLETEDLLAHYSSAQVFAFPTPGEDFGLVPAESLACGTPVVVWGDGAGPTEQVIEGINGYHAKPYDRKDFARKMDKIIDTNLKNKNRKEILENGKKFSFEEAKKSFMGEVNKLLSS